MIEKFTSKGLSMYIRLFMWLAMVIGGAVGGYYLDSLWFSGIQHSVLFHVLSFFLGGILMKQVLTISRNTGRTLAKYGREGNIPRMETNVLVTTGIYARMRHPMHLGLLFFPLAVALIVGSPSFILVISPLEMVLMVVLIRVFEEQEAIKKFGDAYRDYQKNTPMFCLSFRCISALINGK